MSLGDVTSSFSAQGGMRFGNGASGMDERDVFADSFIRVTGPYRDRCRSVHFERSGLQRTLPVMVETFGGALSAQMLVCMRVNVLLGMVFHLTCESHVSKIKGYSVIYASSWCARS